MTTFVSVGQSSSKGNGYILEHDGKKLIIECGIPVREMLAALGHDIKNCHECIVSHSDGDHLGYAMGYMRYFNVRSTTEAADRIYGVLPMLKERKYQLTPFDVTPLHVEHTVECLSFVIQCGKEKILFATDLCDFPYHIPDLTAILIECNYSSELREQALLRGEDVRSRSDGHMELSTCIGVLKRLRTIYLNKVVLLHLSDSLSDEEMFKERIYRETGIRAEVAGRGTRHKLSSDF